MNTQELIDQLHASPVGEGLTKKQVEGILLGAFNKVGDALEAGEDVSLRNFGRFYMHKRNARNGRNPRTGEAISIPERSVVKFKPRGELKV